MRQERINQTKFIIGEDQIFQKNAWKAKSVLSIPQNAFLVGVAGFEPTTSTSQMWRDTGLRYTPIGIFCYQKRRKYPLFLVVQI